MDNDAQHDASEQMADHNQPMAEKRPREGAALSLKETSQSVLWAMLGVQKKTNAHRDFSRGKASHFIVLGLVFGLVFVGVLLAIVWMVLAHSGAQ